MIEYPFLLIYKNYDFMHLKPSDYKDCIRLDKNEWFQEKQLI